MRNRTWAVLLAIAATGTVVAAVVTLSLLQSPGGRTGRWVIIQDISGDRLEVEPTSNETWQALVDMDANRTTRWVGGIVERYANALGFRFRPDTVRVADVTAEGLQATLRHISENLDYWVGGYAYVAAQVVARGAS